MKNIVCFNKPAPQEKNNQNLPRLLLPLQSSGLPSVKVAEKFPKTEVNFKPIDKRDLLCAAILQSTSFPSSWPLKKERSLHNVRLEPIGRSHRQSKVCSDASATATNPSSVTKGLQGMTVVKTQPKADWNLPFESFPMRRPPWKVGKVSSYPLPPYLHSCLSERYQQQSGRLRLLSLKTDRGQAIRQAKSESQPKLPKHPCYATSAVKTPEECMPPEKKQKSSEHQKSFLPILSEPTISKPSHWEGAVHQDKHPSYLKNRTVSWKEVRQRLPQLPNPNILDISQISVPLHLPDYPYGNIHLMLPAVRCPSSLYADAHSKQQASPPDSGPEYQSDYETDFESAYESDSDMS